MARVIEVIVSPAGETSVQTKGYTGSECLQASKWLEKSLGIATTDRKTPEFHEVAQIPQQEVQS